MFSFGKCENWCLSKLLFSYFTPKALHKPSKTSNSKSCLPEKKIWSREIYISGRSTSSQFACLFWYVISLLVFVFLIFLFFLTCFVGLYDFIGSSVAFVPLFTSLCRSMTFISNRRKFCSSAGNYPKMPELIFLSMATLRGSLSLDLQTQ